MDTRNSALVVGLYFAGIIVVGLIGLGYYTYQRSEHPLSDVFDLPERGVVHPSTGAPQYAHFHHTSITRANESLRELQTSLAESRAALEQRTQSLNQKKAECQSLQAELDQSFGVILRLLADESVDSSVADASTQQAKEKLEAELTHSIESLNQLETLRAEQAKEMAKLRADLLRTDLELAAVQEKSEVELAAALSEKTALEAAVNQVVARCGLAAVPALVDRLSDERVEIRRWAARTLGAFGPDAAADATIPLRRMLSDPDATVRDEAQRALASVSGVGVD